MKRKPEHHILPTGPPRRGRHESLAETQYYLKNKEKKHRL